MVTSWRAIANEAVNGFLRLRRISTRQHVRGFASAESETCLK